MHSHSIVLLTVTIHTMTPFHSTFVLIDLRTRRLPTFTLHRFLSPTLPSHHITKRRTRCILTSNASRAPTQPKTMHTSPSLIIPAPAQTSPTGQNSPSPPPPPVDTNFPTPQPTTSTPAEPILLACPNCSTASPHATQDGQHIVACPCCFSHLRRSLQNERRHSGQLTCFPQLLRERSSVLGDNGSRSEARRGEDQAAQRRVGAVYARIEGYVYSIWQRWGYSQERRGNG